MISADLAHTILNCISQPLFLLATPVLPISNLRWRLGLHRVPDSARLVHVGETLQAFASAVGRTVRLIDSAVIVVNVRRRQGRGDRCAPGCWGRRPPRPATSHPRAPVDDTTSRCNQPAATGRAASDTQHRAGGTDDRRGHQHGRYSGSHARAAGPPTADGANRTRRKSERRPPQQSTGEQPQRSIGASVR